MKRLLLALLIAAPLLLSACNNSSTVPAEDEPATEMPAPAPPGPPDPKAVKAEKAMAEALTPRPESVKVIVLSPPVGAKGAVPSESARAEVRYADEHTFGLKGLLFEASGPTHPGGGLRSGVAVTRHDGEREVKVVQFLFDAAGKVIERDWNDQQKGKEAEVEKRCKDILAAMHKAFAK